MVVQTNMKITVLGHETCKSMLWKGAKKHENPLCWQDKIVKLLEGYMKHKNVCCALEKKHEIAV